MVDPRKKVHFPPHLDGLTPALIKGLLLVGFDKIDLNPALQRPINLVHLVIVEENVLAVRSLKGEDEELQGNNLSVVDLCR